ncbi:MAG: YbjN domain-containing protein [Leptolyngbyaceae cyanobacterium SM1_1_3]|nr:YbjN domain-containing protein [Leptolyngbyaceae cyanobacterium SM1_1_3]NJN02915.1 YbjN domain-containing protein [Leptolyngbyaceae cyanobacterium RM1_1_2]
MAINQIDFEASASESADDSAAIPTYIDMIETVISSLEQDQSAMVSHTDESHLWKFAYGSVEVYVQLSGTTADDVLTIWSPVIKLPVQQEAKLMRRLLEMNCGETFEACFGILGDDVVVLASRILEDISATEVSRIMTIVATIADDNDEALKDEFSPLARAS